ncbi:flavocytochrome c [Shewanella sp. 1_MG-2023]|uniref:Flavocytochrome c n=1 Tax=Shewanella electrodiphila TaxID=934143 RepID=A0ABT0KVV7_9GAMM|nr:MULTISPECIES: flavocytochrome c [Shewanella]MCL1047681.1 flavocytochrome c [Shewanella electrodiphila]MDO6613224.1 flavocytochrome c [Shewanella sp. 7_MG-2023]MDO6773104.1 flavocytochrome c [Shewanella sp. 2_MG-2023]MDO6795580.1 flavocytochrome c [Shewanella sp. 1_MG-2023]PMG74895.1 flavocytochrome c [Shewanella sp. 10N.286.51.B7]
MSNVDLLGRRKFIAGLGVAAGAAMVAPAMAVSEKADGVKWDKEIEIVIIGSGFAGLAAAIEATKLGAKDVHIFEKMSYFGGNSAINGGLFAAPGTPMQSKEGVNDSVERMVADQMAAGRGIADEALLRHVAEHAMEALQMTFDAGSEYHPYLQQLGGHSVARTYQTTVSCGAGITQPLLHKCRELGVHTHNRSKFEGFLIGDKGEVVGVKMRDNYHFGEDQPGKIINIRAKRGVIMATGGFAQNVNLRMAQDPTLTSEVGCTNAPGATGEGMYEMFRLGAVPVHLAHIQSGPWASPDEGGFGYVSNYSIYNFPHSIAINRLTGQRFMNEIADRKTRADAELACRDEKGNALPPILITSYKDSKKHPNTKKVIKYNVGWKFDSVEELAAHFKVPLKALKTQIEEYNQYVKSGEDTQFGKNMTKAKDKYIEAPFTVVRLWPKVHYCQGGVQITTKAEVKDSFTGNPIKGLYAAGEVCGGIHGVSRLGSCSIPECMVMGMTAARSTMKA